ncbi:MAG: flagellin [Micrococcus sp.]|nr:flagellin [Micrococcus sp.]
MSVINTNVAANNTYRLMSMAAEDKASSMEKLSSGLRINRAADDAAGLSIAEGLRSQANGLEVAARNISDGVSMAQTAEGGLAAAGDILQRIRDLAVQAGNDSNNEAARAAITTEVTALTQELTRMSESINFNGSNLLGATNGAEGDGTTGIFSFQVGANASDKIDLNLSGARLDTLVTNMTTAGLTFDTAENAATAITTVDTAIAAVSAARSSIGAVQNRLEYTLKHVNVTAENLTNAESNIRDVDMAKEIVKQSAASIKEQASQAMLAQANQSTQGVLQLLR